MNKDTHQHEKAHQHKHHQHHDHHEGMMEDFKKRCLVSTLLSLPVLLFSPMIQEFLGYEWTFNGQSYLLFGISSFIFFYGGRPFLSGLADELKNRSPGMMTLIATAITVAYVYSSAVVFGLRGKTFFWELVTLIDLMLFGHWIEMKSVLGASKALEKLADLMPAEAHLLTGEEVKDVPLDQLEKDNLILVRPGEKIPADGIIVEGESHLNESMLTGESTPVKRSKGDEVIGGSVNGSGSLKVKILKTGKDSYLNKVVAMVEESQKSKSKTQHLADRAAKWLTYIALSTGFITLAAWLLAGKDFQFALERMVTVMVISCPHALGLAIPLVVAISTSMAARNGLLIRNRTAFENARKISVIVFDKTGTLTTGIFGVTRLVTLDKSIDENKILQYASALEQNSEHPIAGGILKKLKSLNLQIPSVSNFNSITGKGVEGSVDNHNIKVVSPGYLKENQLDIPENAYENKAETVVFVLIDDIPAGFIALADEIREESFEAIKKFKENHIKVIMATGDHEKVAKAVSDKLQLDGYYAEVLPENKVDKIKALKNKGEFVAMTGDGVNDAPALAEADIGIAVGSGTDVAAETADIVLANSNPKDILRLILFGKATYRKMIQNLVWATAYNVIAIPLAAGVLFSFGIMPGPAIGAIFMSLSTVVVAINAQLLKPALKK